MRFFFDYISPYAYVGWHEALKVAAAYRRTLTPEPVVFAAILNALGQKGPAEIPAKRVYTFKDALRKAHRAGLPLEPPPSHPFNPLVALRATLLVPDSQRHRAVTALYHATWGGGDRPHGVETEEAVRLALDGAGFDGAELVRRTTDPAVKAELKARTAAAIELGVFGVPTIEAEGELFFGVDGLAFLPAFLEGRDPVPADAAARWADLPSSANRVR